MIFRTSSPLHFISLLVSVSIVQKSDSVSSEASFVESLTVEIKEKTNWKVSDILLIKSRNFESYTRKSDLLIRFVLQSISQTTKILLNSTDMDLKYRSYLRSYRLQQPCSIVFHQDVETIQLRGIFMDKILPGGIFRSFHIFANNENKTINLQALEVKYSSTVNFEKLNSVPYYPSVGLFDTSRPDWKKETLKMTVTSILIPPNVNLFKSTGKWDLGCFGHTHYAALLLNATPTFIKIGKPATRRSTAINDGLDDYLNPLLSGQMHTACKIFDPSMIHYGIVYLSKTTEYDKITFVTRTPETKKIHSLFQSLTYPFDSTLWGFTGISVICVTIVVFLAMNLFDKNPYISSQSVLNNFSKVTISMLRTALDQPGFEMDVPSHVKLNSYSWHVLLLWGSFASLILCNVYKSVLISALVKPDFVFVPKTFQQLVESSWKVNAMLYNDSLKILFVQINDSMTRVLLERTKGVAFVTGTTQCMIDVVESTSVCMGHASPVKLFSILQLTSSQGKGIYRVSDDGIFSSFGTMGVSRKHPHVLDAILEVQNAMDTSGIAKHWRDVGLAESKKTGRNNSRKKNGTSVADRVLLSSNEHFNDGNWNLLSNLLEVEFIGLGISLGTFFAEILFSCRIIESLLRCNHATVRFISCRKNKLNC